MYCGGEKSSKTGSKMRKTRETKTTVERASRRMRELKSQVSSDRAGGGVGVTAQKEPKRRRVQTKAPSVVARIRRGRQRGRRQRPHEGRGVQRDADCNSVGIARKRIRTTTWGHSSRRGQHLGGHLRGHRRGRSGRPP